MSKKEPVPIVVDPAELAVIVEQAVERALARQAESSGAEWGRVSGRVVRLRETKNGDAREVPLSRKAAQLIERARGLDRTLVFPVRAQTMDATFRRARDEAGISDLHFHDTRHTAATRIGSTVGQAGRLSFPEFVAMFGWRDPKNAMVYVNPSAEALARKLD